MKRYLLSTISGEQYPFERLSEFADNGESLEVKIEGLKEARIRKGSTVWERFASFFPFDTFTSELSLGEGDTPLLKSSQLSKYVGIDSLFLKNETMNPTWSFKDRGSLTCILMAKELGETVAATISTGNMGASIAAYAARVGMKAIVFISPDCAQEKIQAMAIHGATIVRVNAQDYSEVKKKLLSEGESLNLRIVSGNGPMRVEGYKSVAFELWEQLAGQLPDFIAVPTSACGNIRGIFKGFRELQEAGFISKLPRMIIAQAANCSPLVTALRQKAMHPVVFAHPHTVATAIATGNPTGGDEILDKAYQYDWLAEDASEEEILASQKILAKAGFFVEPSSATTLVAVKKLRKDGKIKKSESVVLVLTGSGLKDSSFFNKQRVDIVQLNIDNIAIDLPEILNNSK